MADYERGLDDEDIIQRQKWFRGQQPVPPNLPPGVSGPGLFPVIRVGASQISPQIAPVLFVPQAVSTGISPVIFDVLFPEPVIGFKASSVLFSGSAGPSFVRIESVLGSKQLVGNNQHFKVFVYGMVASGTVSISIPAGAVMNGAGVLSQASVFDGSPVIYSLPGTNGHVLLRVVIVTGVERFSVISDPPQFNFTYAGAGAFAGLLVDIDVFPPFGTFFNIKLISIVGTTIFDVINFSDPITLISPSECTYVHSGAPIILHGISL